MPQEKAHATRSLGASIRTRAASLAQAQNTYKQNLVAVNSFASGVLTSSLPTLNPPPPDFGSFVTAYVQANGDALDWANNVLARLQNVPAEVQTYNDSITSLLKDAQMQASTLAGAPKNQAALSALNQNLSLLAGQFNLIVTFISAAVTGIQDFQNSLPDMAAQLQAIATKSAQDAGADVDQVKVLLDDVFQLIDEIVTLGEDLISTLETSAIVIVIGLIGTLFAAGLAWLVIGVTALVAWNTISLDAQQIVADLKEVEADIEAMVPLVQQACTLGLLALNFSLMANQSTKIQTNLQAVLSQWQTLESDVNADIAAIQASIADGQASSFQAVANDLANAKTEWSAAYSQAGALHVSLKVNTAQLQIGMSQSEAQAALAAGQEIDIINYYNQVAAVHSRPVARPQKE